MFPAPLRKQGSIDLSVLLAPGYGSLLSQGRGTVDIVIPASPFVIPAKAGIQGCLLRGLRPLGPGYLLRKFRGDENGASAAGRGKAPDGLPRSPDLSN